MTETELLARDIYLRVMNDRILSGGPKAWAVEEKQARKIAVACLDAAAVFMDEIAVEPPPA